MVRKIYSRNTEFRAISELKKAIIDAWHQVDQQLIDKLYASLDDRLSQIIRRDEDPIDY